MLFPYKLQPVRQPVTALGGRRVRPRPLVTVTLIGPGGAYVQTALLDTGADDTVFSELVAQRIGIDLSQAPQGRAAGIGSGAVPLRYADVTLRVSQGQERREWNACVGFTPVQLRHPLLGFAGFLQFFTATFRGDLEEAELTVNSAYSGT
jgi:hypothetical protein